MNRPPLRQQLLLLVALLCLLSCTACTTGLIYSDTAVPLVTNMNATPNPKDAKRVKLNGFKLSEPITGLDFNVEISSFAIGDAAKKAGLTEIYYADRHTVSFLFGIYENQTVVVTGK